MTYRPGELCSSYYHTKEKGNGSAGPQGGGKNELCPLLLQNCPEESPPPLRKREVELKKQTIHIGPGPTKRKTRKSKVFFHFPLRIILSSLSKNIKEKQESTITPSTDSKGGFSEGGKKSSTRKRRKNNSLSLSGGKKFSFSLLEGRNPQNLKGEKVFQSLPTLCGVLSYDG